MLGNFARGTVITRLTALALLTFCSFNCQRESQAP